MYDRIYHVYVIHIHCICVLKMVMIFICTKNFKILAVQFYRPK